MASAATAGGIPTIGAEDLLPVRSRISWGAIFAGAVCALACQLLLTLLGGAIGLSIGPNTRGDTLTTAAAFWAIFTAGASLYLGGWVTSQTTVGENRTEAIIHGTIVWGTLFAMLLYAGAAGLRTGFNAMLGVAYAGGQVADTADRNNVSRADLERYARQFGIPQDQIDAAKRAADNPAGEARAAADKARDAANDPANRQAAHEYAAKSTWLSLLGLVSSLATAIVGAIVGSGPAFRILPTAVVGTHATAGGTTVGR